MNGTGLPFQDMIFMLVIGGVLLWPLYPIAFLVWLFLGRGRGAVRPWTAALYLLPLVYLAGAVAVPYRADLWLKARGWSDPILLSSWAALAAGPLTTILAVLLDRAQGRRAEG